jgi:hypothetical protein
LCHSYHDPFSRKRESLFSLFGPLPTNCQLNNNAAPAAAAVPFTNEWVVTFTDPVNNSVIGNSIANGAYSISINPALVTVVSGGENLLAGETDTFYRPYGDVTGAQSVKNVDVNAFNRAWGNAYYSAGYNAALDFNDDGKYTNIDANAFNRAFNTRYSVLTTI